MYVARTASAFVFFIVAGSVAHSADCHVDPYRFIWGVDSATHMAVRPGKPCSSHMQFGGGAPSSFQIAQNAQNGVATASNGVWQYRSKPGYVGKDSFVVQLVGEAMGRQIHSGTTNIAVDVDVAP